MAHTHSHPGLVKLEQGYQVSVWAPHAASVSISGEFNDWAEKGSPLSQSDNGVWTATIKKLQNGQQYQFGITDSQGNVLKRNDPRSRLLTNSVGASVVYDDDYQWPDKGFVLPSWDKLVIYELHIGTFNRVQGNEDGAPGVDAPGTFSSAIEKLDYLKQLGINCIELMPVNEFAGDFSWGYNPAYPFAVEEAYGGPNGLKDFVSAAHSRDIGVILDVVYNHFGPSDLHLWQFDGWSENGKGGIYFYNDWRSDTPWGDTRPDYGRPEVRQYIFDNAMMWLEEFRMDGLRMDMIPYMRSVSGGELPQDSIQEACNLIRWINSEAKTRFAHKLIIAEDLHGHDFVSDSTDNGGLGYGAQWDADFVHPVRDVLTQSEDDSRDLNLITKALSRRYCDRAFARVVYVESHDEVANGKARLAEEIAPGNVDKDYFARQRSVIGAALTLTAPGIPMLFQGQELLEDMWFDDQDPIDWTRLEKFPQLNKAYKTLINLRKTAAGLSAEQVTFVHQDDDNKILVYRREPHQKGEGSILVLINFKNNRHEDYQLDDINPQHWQCVFNWHNGYHEPENFSFTDKDDGHKTTLTIEPYQVLIFSQK